MSTFASNVVLGGNGMSVTTKTQRTQVIASQRLGAAAVGRDSNPIDHANAEARSWLETSLELPGADASVRRASLLALLETLSYPEDEPALKALSEEARVLAERDGDEVLLATVNERLATFEPHDEGRRMLEAAREFGRTQDALAAALDDYGDAQAIDGWLDEGALVEVGEAIRIWRRAWESSHASRPP